MKGRYVRPQESGNRGGLEWISMQNEKGVGLVIMSDSTGNGSVMGHTAQEMKQVRHWSALPKSDRWILRYDAKLSVLNKQPNIDFADRYPFSYTIRLLDGSETADMLLSSSYLVHGLDTSADNVAKARAYLRPKNLYGSVSVAQYDEDPSLQ